MSAEWVRFLKFHSLKFGRYFWRRKGLWLRGLLCWLIGIAFVAFDREHEYDLRLQMRGVQKVDPEIILVNIDNEGPKRANAENIEDLGILTESINSGDSAYWAAERWSKMLEVILRENPTAVGISPFWGENTNVPETYLSKDSVFQNPKVVWSVHKDSDGKVLLSKFSKKKYTRNSGLNEIYSDRDGVTRRFSDPYDRFPIFAMQLADRVHENIDEKMAAEIQASGRVINFRGPNGTFPHIEMSDVIQRRFPKNYFNKKLVLVGFRDIDGYSYRTPVGEMSRMEINANIVDNILNDRLIERLSPTYISLLLLFFVLLVAVITSNYPQFLSLFSIVIANIFYTSVSVWIFDAYYFWTPIFAPLLVSILTYFIFLSFQLTLKEYLNVQLENEHQMLVDLEELKNNFLSLISHDLKTPIAKIQGICDRLISKYPDQEFSADIYALRNVASELHRYIRTILQITRVESRDFRINKDATDINEIIEAVVQQLEPLAKNKRIHLNANLEPMFLIEVDHLLIHEVILNLIENAIKYTPEGGEVVVSSQEVDDRVIVMVQDSGPGIPESERQKIFEKFFRGELGKSQPKGSGLGLYLVKYFVELHEGKVFLDSSPKRGTKIGFSLPISAQTEAVGYRDHIPTEIGSESVTGETHVT